MPRSINAAGLALIKSYEKLRLEPYQDQAGVWTIGWGHTAGVTADTPPIGKDEADEWLTLDLMHAENSVAKFIRISLGDNQYAALVSLVYNCGAAPLIHTLGAYLNGNNFERAADEFLKWDKVHIGEELVESNGLLKRRKEERALFLTPV